MFIFHCNDWRFKMFSNLEYSLFPYSYFFVFFPNAFVVCTQISVSRKLNRSTWSIWSLACSQALVWAKESAVQSGPTHNYLCLASLLQLNANETPTLLFMKVQIRCLIVQNIYSSYWWTLGSLVRLGKLQQNVQWWYQETLSKVWQSLPRSWGERLPRLREGARNVYFEEMSSG